MPPTGKDAILAAARAIDAGAACDSDADANGSDSDADWANWGGVDWKNLDVSLYDDDDDDDGDDDDGGGDGDGPADPNAPLRPEDVGLPPRLASWLVRHRCGDVRRARDAIGRRSSRSKRTTTPDADGHVALGGARPKYAPLHERPPAKVLPCARPMPRDDDFEPPDVVARRRALEDAGPVTEVVVDGGGVKYFAQKSNAATTAAAVDALRRAAVREREMDLPRGAGPAGRWSPERGGGGAGLGGRGGGHDDDEEEEGGGGGLLAAALARVGAGRRNAKTAAVSRGTASKRGGAGLATYSPAADAALHRLFPPNERPLIDQTIGVHSKSVVPRATRQTALDRFVAAALRAEAAAAGGDAIAIEPDAAWMNAHVKARRRAVTRAREAEARVHARSTSKLVYRSLSTAAFKTTTAADAGADVAAAVAAVAAVGGDDAPAGDEEEEEGGGGGGPARATAADRAAAATAASVAAAAARAVAKDAGAGATLAGFLPAVPGSLLQRYVSEAAARVDLTRARVVRGDASLAFFYAAAKRTRPDPPGGEEGRRRAAAREIAAAVVAASAAATTASPAANAPRDAVPGHPDVVAAVTRFVATYLTPLVDVGVLTSARGDEVLEKVVRKVMARKASRERDASFLDDAREAEKIRELARAYVQMGRGGGGVDNPKKKRRRA